MAEQKGEKKKKEREEKKMRNDRREASEKHESIDGRVKGKWERFSKVRMTDRVNDDTVASIDCDMVGSLRDVTE